MEDLNVSSCLICGVDNYPPGKDNLCLENLIDKHLSVIFLLRNVLEVPVDKLVNYLKGGSNVEEWISVCDKCVQMVANCKGIYQDILTKQDQFRILRLEIIAALKGSPRDSPRVKREEEKDGDDIKNFNVREDVREYIHQNEYEETIDPFIDGDRLCREKVFKMNEDKTEAVEADSEDDKLNWTSGSEHKEEEFIQMPQQVGDLGVISTNELVVQEDPLSLPMTIALESDFDDDDIDDSNDDDIRKGDGDGDNDADFEPDDELSDEEDDHDMAYKNSSGDDEGQDNDDSGADQDVDESDRDHVESDDNKKKSEGTIEKCRRRRNLKGFPKPIFHSNGDTDTFSCPICSKKYPTFAECSKHIQCLHYSRTKYICNLCGSTTDNQATLNRHQEKCTGVSYPCPLAPSCLRRFFKIHSLRIHLRDTHGKVDQHNLPPKVQKLLKKIREQNTKCCDTCGKVFKTNALCQRHREFYHEKKWKCSRCGVVKWTGKELERHEATCSPPETERNNGQTWTCPVEECGLLYKTYRALTIHMGRLHKDHEKPVWREEDRPIINCESCGAEFNRRCRLNHHRKYSIKCRIIRGLVEPEVDKREIKEHCDICGKGFQGKKSVTGHKRKVHGIRLRKAGKVIKINKVKPAKGGGGSDTQKFICESCGVVFEKRGNLRSHRLNSIKCREIRGLGRPEKKKEGDKVICQICGKGYQNRNGYRAHVRQFHEGRYTKRCEICGRGCEGQGDLDRHLWRGHGVVVGEGVDRWKCEVEGCGAMLVGRKKREVHMNKMHSREREWGCGECGRRYLHERTLQRHVKVVHREGGNFKKKNKEGAGEDKGVEVKL